MKPLTNKKTAARSGQAAGYQKENRVSISPVPSKDVRLALWAFQMSDVRLTRDKQIGSYC